MRNNRKRLLRRSGTVHGNRIRLVFYVQKNRTRSSSQESVQLVGIRLTAERVNRRKTPLLEHNINCDYHLTKQVHCIRPHKTLYILLGSVLMTD